MTKQYALDPSILRAYDIRGVVGSTLHMNDAYALGRAFATQLSNQLGDKRLRVAVGYDGRKSSIQLEEELVQGLVESGVDVICIGLGPSPMLYFAVKHLTADGGIMITGSHNPPEYNGFKLLTSKATLFGDDIQQLGRMVGLGHFVDGDGTPMQHDIMPDYIEALLGAYRAREVTKDLKVAWDAGNGAAGDVMVALCKQLPGEHILLNEVIDGTFPAHHPDPTVAENLQQLIETVKNEQCDFGVAFDGDGDRIGAVDGMGRIIWGDQLLTFFARDVLKAHPGATIIADVKASQTLFDDIKLHQGEAVMWKTGHSLIKAKMAETDAKLAGEMSGHIFFADQYYGYDDALYAAVRLLNLAARSEQNLTDMMGDLPRVYNTPEMRIACAEEEKFAIVDAILLRLQNDGANINAIDGVRVNTEHGWWLIRASNTQPVLVARCESTSPDGLEFLKNQVAEQLAKSGISFSEAA